MKLFTRFISIAVILTAIAEARVDPYSQSATPKPVSYAPVYSLPKPTIPSKEFSKDFENYYVTFKLPGAESFEIVCHPWADNQMISTNKYVIGPLIHSTKYTCGARGYARRGMIFGPFEDFSFETPSNLPGQIDVISSSITQHKATFRVSSHLAKTFSTSCSDTKGTKLTSTVTNVAQEQGVADIKCSGMKPNTAYKCKITAIGQDGLRGLSKTVDFKTLDKNNGAPEKPTIVNVDLKNTYAIITSSIVSGSTSYHSRCCDVTQACLPVHSDTVEFGSYVSTVVRDIESGNKFSCDMYASNEHGNGPSVNVVFETHVA